MNYRAHYDKLISRARWRVVFGYAETHHIIPKCMGGSNRAENLVLLLPEEHYVAHQLLVKIHPGNHKLIKAAFLMGTTDRYNNKKYGWLRRKYAATVSSFHSGRKRPPETGRKISAAALKRFKDPAVGDHLSRVRRGMRFSDDHRRHLSEAKKGKTISQETRQKMRLSAIGKKKSTETIERMRIAKRNISQETRARMRAASLLREAIRRQG
jgi:hypothetical protein